nr:Methyltransferase-like protein 13 [Haemonchus contortus]
MTIRLKRPRVYYAFILLVISTSLFIYFVNNLLHIEEPETILSDKDFLNLVISKYGQERILAEQCVDGSCFVVKDVLYRGLLFLPLERVLIDKETKQVKASAMLRLPSTRVLSKTDTKRWPLNRSHFAKNTLEYAIVEAALLSRALSLFTSTPADVLIIGIGSATIANFIQYHYHQSNITILEEREVMAHFLIDWFQIILGPRLGIIVPNKQEQLGTIMENQDSKYHVVFYNMCPQSIANGSCPDERTLSEHIIRTMVKRVGDQGVLIVSMITADVDTIFYMMQKHRFEQYFNECILIKPAKAYNQVLSCTQNHHDFNLEKQIESFMHSQWRKNDFL